MPVAYFSHVAAKFEQILITALTNHCEDTTAQVRNLDSILYKEKVGLK